MAKKKKKERRKFRVCLPMDTTLTLGNLLNKGYSLELAQAMISKSIVDRLFREDKRIIT